MRATPPLHPRSQCHSDRKSSIISRILSTGSIFLNPESAEELLDEAQGPSHDPGDGGQYGMLGYVSPLGGFVGHADGAGFGGLSGGPHGGPGGPFGGPGPGGPGGF